MKLSKILLSLSVAAAVTLGCCPAKQVQAYDMTKEEATEENIDAFINRIGINDKSALYEINCATTLVGRLSAGSLKTIEANNITSKIQGRAWMNKINGEKNYPDYITKSLNALSTAWANKNNSSFDSSVEAAEKAIVNGSGANVYKGACVSGFTWMDMAYLETQLDQLKASTASAKGRKNVLIIGDSVTCGSLAGVENTYWRQLEKKNNWQVSILAVPGIGAASPAGDVKGATRSVPNSLTLYDYFKDEMPKNYDEIIFAIGANDISNDARANYYDNLKNLMHNVCNNNTKYAPVELIDFSFKGENTGHYKDMNTLMSNWNGSKSNTALHPITHLLCCGLKTYHSEISKDGTSGKKGYVQLGQDGIHPTPYGHGQLYTIMTKQKILN